MITITAAALHGDTFNRFIPISGSAGGNSSLGFSEKMMHSLTHLAQMDLYDLMDMYFPMPHPLGEQSSEGGGGPGMWPAGHGFLYCGDLVPALQCTSLVAGARVPHSNDSPQESLPLPFPPSPRTNGTCAVETNFHSLGFVNKACVRPGAAVVLAALRHAYKCCVAEEACNVPLPPWKAHEPAG